MYEEQTVLTIRHRRGVWVQYRLRAVQSTFKTYVVVLFYGGLSKNRQVFGRF